LKIAIDAMGGDYAPKEIVLGAIDACREFGAKVILVGVENDINNALRDQAISGLMLEICPSSEIITMDEHPANAVRRKKNSSLVVANQLVKEGRAAAVISAGSTGAAMTASLLTLGRIHNIKRPAIAVFMPTIKGVSILLDAGANANCAPDNLVEFALMGAIYVEHILEIKNPKIGLLSINKDELRGNHLVVETHQLLKKMNLNFIGNIEGRDIPYGICDIIVCDGFTGNVVLKTGEGIASAGIQLMKKSLQSASWLARMSSLFILPSIKSVLKKIDSSEYGGAPLLGLNGLSIISHGNSNSRAIKNAIRAATKAVDEDIIGKLSNLRSLC
jgi:glycerol-3-phosphate acyltransferase PlsX